jgi:hypothetical protein
MRHLTLTLVALTLATVAFSDVSLAATQPAAQTSAARRCSTLHSKGLRVRITIDHGRVSCATARSIIRRYYRGEGKKHGGPSNAETYYTIGKWRCGPGAGGVGCNNGKRYDTAESLIFGETY